MDPFHSLDNLENQFALVTFCMYSQMTTSNRLQTTHHTSSGAVASVSASCCVYCVDTAHPSNWGPIYSFWASRECGSSGLQLIKAGDGETNPGPPTTHKQVCICHICHKKIRRYQHSTIYRYLVLPSTPPFQTLVQAPYTLPTYSAHTTATQTQTHVQHSPCSYRTGKAQTQSSCPLTPPVVVSLRS